MADDVYPPDYESDLGGIRVLIPDVEQVDFTGEGQPAYIFSDGQLLGFLRLARGRRESARIKRAAAMAMRAIGNSEGLIQKVIRTEDLQTDGAKIQQAFLAAARGMEQHAQEDDEDEDEDQAFAVVDFQAQPPDPLPYGMRGFPASHVHVRRRGGA